MSGVLDSQPVTCMLLEDKDPVLPHALHHREFRGTPLAGRFAIGIALNVTCSSSKIPAIIVSRPCPSLTLNNLPQYRPELNISRDCENSSVVFAFTVPTLQLFSALPKQPLSNWQSG